MHKKYQLALHIFRRDLRLEDNTALVYSLKNSNRVIPCFIFDKRQISNNDYYSNNAFEFMTNSLQELSDQLIKKNSRLYLFEGIAEELIEELVTKQNIDLVTVNRDYTPFSIQRDEKIAGVCRKKNIPFISFADTLLTEPERIRKNDGLPYTVFTHYFRKAKTIPIRLPQKNNFNNYFKKDISIRQINDPDQFLTKSNPDIFLKGARDEGLRLVKNIENLSDYDRLRNYPSENHTSNLSAHHKFGTISIRETYQKIKQNFDLNHPLITELFWRDFFTHIGFHFPHVFSGAFKKKYDALKWQNDQAKFNAWKNGETGFPIVDAGIRQLNKTGFMHNRLRMITASFLIKDLHINWQWGEKYFAQKLIDYDPSVNNGNWQWAASTGCDAQPYFRIFNPLLQQKKYDKDCAYIKKWIPELRNYSAKQIHNFEKGTIKDYPPPIISHKKEAVIAKELFSNL